MASDDERDIDNGHADTHDEQEEEEEEEEEQVERPRELPADLPRSLDDRKSVPTYGETEYYDGWQNQSQFITAPTLAKPINFNLALHEPDDDDFGNDDAHMAQMLAAQARAGTEPDAAEMEEDAVLSDDKMSRDQKTQALQNFLFMAASNGDARRVQRLVRGPASDLVDVDAVDAEGTPPLVYASCFGHKDVVLAVLDAGATVDMQDKNQWTALMWAMTNRHKDIAKILLDHGASTDAKSSSGRTALDFVPPNSDISDLLQHRGYSIGNAGVTDDFYNAGLAQDRFEEELAESEMRRRMLMESAINLEIDLGNLDLDDRPESPEDLEEGQDFVWDRCLHDQMFVFMDNDIERILDIVITKMAPLRSPSQKPVPANIVFLGARYAHYHADKDLLDRWLSCAADNIEHVVETHQWDMTILAFWISNATLLIYYLRKDPGLSENTISFQSTLTDLIQEIYILIIRDAERRMDKVIQAAMLEHETIPGFEDIHFQNEWGPKFLRTKSKVKPEPAEKRFRPPSPRRKAQVSPRNITSLLSSTLFVLDLYEVHPVITAQILSQLYYWLGAEIFNRIMSNKRYLARTKAMQIRMNVSMLEDWARSNNRQPLPAQDHQTSAPPHSPSPLGEATVEAARRHLAPVVQLLQWLQCFSSLGEDKEAMESTVLQLPALNSGQLVHAVRHYRAEVGEKGLSKHALKEIMEIKNRPPPKVGGANGAATSTDATGAQQAQSQQAQAREEIDDDSPPQSHLLNQALLLPFQLPTATDMLQSYGAGLGGVNREREKRYIPSVPPDFLAKLEPDEGGGKVLRGIYEGVRFSDGESS
jgi:hypothetical protein